jgi:DNA-binding GntR family transcriptional regulator
MSPSSLLRSSLKEQITEIIKQRILTGDIKPGERITEMNLAKEFGTSQAPVREALRSLESQGFLEHKTHSGTRVKSLDNKEILEINQIRAALEIQAVTDGFTKLQEQLYELEQIMENIQQYKTSVEYLDKINQFHEIVFKAYNNKTMWEMWESLSIQVRMASPEQLTNELIEQSSFYLNSFLESLKKGNTRKAAAEIRNYYGL